MENFVMDITNKAKQMDAEQYESLIWVCEILSRESGEAKDRLCAWIEAGGHIGKTGAECLEYLASIDN